VWSKEFLVTRKEACRPADFDRYLACCGSLVCIAELFSNLVEGSDSPTLGLKGSKFQFLESRIYSRAHESFIQALHFVTTVRWEANDANMILSS
jgi:hypothetical protein